MNIVEKLKNLTVSQNLEKELSPYIKNWSALNKYFKEMMPVPEVLLCMLKMEIDSENPRPLIIYRLVSRINSQNSSDSIDDLAKYLRDEDKLPEQDKILLGVPECLQNLK
jgi:hypothetical protein